MQRQFSNNLWDPIYKFYYKMNTNYIINNDIVIYSLCSITICLIIGAAIKAHFNSTLNETPNSPQTFNFTLDQLKEIEDKAENSTKEFKPIISNEDFKKY